MVTDSKFETMRSNSENWKLGIIYYCADDPRVVVRQNFLFGWTWNFANPWFPLAMVVAVLTFAGPAAIAWFLGARSVVTLGMLFVGGLCLNILGAHRLSREPSGRE